MKAFSSTPLDPSLAEFIASGLSIHIGAASRSREPTLVRGLGCRVSADRRQVSVLVARSQSQAVMAAVQATGLVAAVFNQPENHRTVQLKGEDATLEAATEEDRQSLTAYADRMSERLTAFEVPRLYSRTLLSCDPNDLVVISFSPLSAFLQSPGASAGSRMPAGGELPW